MSKKAVINISLDQTKDADIIAYLEHIPKTYAIKRALRAYMEAEKRVELAVSTSDPVNISHTASEDKDEIPF